MQYRFNIKQMPRRRVVIGYASCGLLSLLAIAMFCPVAPDSSFAETGSIPLAVNVEKATTTIAVSVDSDINMQIEPKFEGDFKTAATNLRVTTNNDTGYKVYLSATNGGKLTLGEGSDASINPVAGTLNSTNYKEHLNSWGYTNLSGAEAETANYAAIPSTMDTEIFGSEYAGDDSYKLGFAAAVDNKLPSGKYQGEVTFTAITNPVDVATLSRLIYMQDMTTEICANTPINPGDPVRAQLTDKRDGKKYWVAKLKDGNCWMQENLALTLSGTTNEAGGNYATGVDGAPLTADDSDLGDVTKLGDTTYNGDYTWKPTNSTRTVVSDNSDNNGTDSWTLDTGNATIGTQWYYQWNTATAGTGQYSMDSGALAQGSICPKGWKLPLAKDSNNDKNGSFYKLLAAYSPSGIIDTSSDAILLAQPLNFVRGGAVQGGALMNIGTLSRYWSRVGRGGSGAHDLVSSAYNVYTSGSDYGHIGETIRCVATVE